MNPPYGFGLAQEDARTEAAALALPGGKVLCVASAGDVPLSLLALGADEVVGIDVDVHQLHLCELKLAAVVALEREEAIAFLGFAPATTGERARCLKRVAKQLPHAAAAFWERHRNAALSGAIFAGRYERYVRMLRLLVWPIAGRSFRDLAACELLEEQRTIFARAFDGPILQRLFRVAFKPRLYGGRGIDQAALLHVGDSEPGVRFFERFREMCTLTPARENYLLQTHLLGRVIDSNAVPEYLTESGFHALRERVGAVRFEQASILDYVDAPRAGRFDRFHLSNLPDWLPAVEFERLFGAIAQHAAKPARVVWRYLHRDPALTDDAVRRIHIDRDLGEALRVRDRFPVYAVEVAEIGAAS